MKNICIDLTELGDRADDAFRKTMRLDPDKIIFIGSDSKLERLARESGHEVEVLPPGSPMPENVTVVSK